MAIYEVFLHGVGGAGLIGWKNPYTFCQIFLVVVEPLQPFYVETLRKISTSLRGRSEILGR